MRGFGLRIGSDDFFDIGNIVEMLDKATGGVQILQLLPRVIVLVFPAGKTEVFPHLPHCTLVVYHK
jgi:hypothetical protein